MTAPTFTEYWLAIAVVWLLALLPGVAYGFYKRSFIRGLGVTTLVLFVFTHIAYLIEPRLISAERWAYVYVVPFLVFWKSLVDHREFFRACGWFGIAAGLWMIVRVVLRTFLAT